MSLENVHIITPAFPSWLVLPVKFSRPRDPASVRADSRYTELRNYIWEELRPSVVV